MTTITVTGTDSFGFDWDLSGLAAATLVSASATEAIYTEPGGQATYTLDGDFTGFDGDGAPTDGTINALIITDIDGQVATISGLSLTVPQFQTFVQTNDGVGLVELILAGDDSISSGDGADTLIGQTGNDSLEGGLGNDTLYGGEGDDALYGGHPGDYVSVDAPDVSADFAGLDSNLVNGLGGVAGFGERQFGPDDDGQTYVDISAALTHGLNIDGGTYSSMYVGTNGYVNIGGLNLSAFSADLYSRGSGPTSPGGNSTGTSLVHIDVDDVNHVVTVTWDDVGRYSGTTEPLAFQIQISDKGNGDFDVVYRYENTDAQYHTSSISLGGQSLDFTATDMDQSSGNMGETGVYAFEIRNGTIYNIEGNGDGADSLYGGDGADTLDGGTGRDNLDGGAGADNLYGGDQGDQIYGGNDDDYVEGGAGNDYIDGGDGWNTLYGGDGNDQIYGGYKNYGGEDQVYGGAGDDQITIGAHGYVEAGEGNDTISINGAGATVYGGDGADIFQDVSADYGDADTLTGGDGSDTYQIGYVYPYGQYTPDIMASPREVIQFHC